MGLSHAEQEQSKSKPLRPENEQKRKRRKESAKKRRGKLEKSFYLAGSYLQTSALGV